MKHYKKDVFSLQTKKTLVTKVLKKVTNVLIFYYLNDIAEAMDISPLWELSIKCTTLLITMEVESKNEIFYSY